LVVDIVPFTLSKKNSLRRVPGGLWLLKDKELAYCNANNRAREGEVLCGKLREPLKGQACS
jgi:hypothetical protein